MRAISIAKIGEGFVNEDAAILMVLVVEVSLQRCGLIIWWINCLMRL